MKNIKFLLGLLTFAVVMASCATTQNTTGEDEYYDTNARTQQVGNRLYIQDPFYGNVILERDPLSGRYYDVTYGNRYGSPYYGNPYGYRRYYRSYGVGGGRVQQGPTREQIQSHKEGTRKTILGGRR